jgi:hypothetical protein
MNRPHSHAFLLMSVLSVFLGGCGGFNGVVTPTLSKINPTTVAAGGAGFNLTATGSNFVAGTVILWDGSALPTTVNSATGLTGTVSAAQIASGGIITIRAMKPDTTTSGALTLTITGSGTGGGGSGAPAPTLSSITPNTSPNGISSPLTLTANGTNFVSGSQVIWNGVAMTTTFVSSTQLTASIPTSYFGTADIGTSNVFVLNPNSTASNDLPFTITISPSTVPNLISVANANGTTHSLVGDPGFTLTLNGTLFATGATAYFGGTALPTTVVSSTLATAQVPASALTAAAEVPVTIQNTASKASNPIPYYVGMNIYFDESSDVVWDSRNNLLYVSKPTTAQHNTDTVMAFSPLHLTDASAIWIYQLPAGSNPDRLALSTDGKLYVGLDGAGTVQQLSITGAATPPTAGITITFGSDATYGPYFAMDLQISPISTSTIAVARGNLNSPTVALGGVAIYDGTVQRPQTVSPSTQSTSVLLDTIQWSANGNTIYAANNENATGDLYELTVAPNGVSLASGNDHPGVFTIPNLYIHLDGTSGTLYGDDGLVVNPAKATVTGDFQANGIMVPDQASGNAYFVAHPPDDKNVLEYFVQSYSLTSLALGSSLDLYQVQGIPQHLIRWNDSSNGTSGLSFTTKKFNCVFTPCTVGDGRLYVVDIPF